MYRCRARRGLASGFAGINAHEERIVLTLTPGMLATVDLSALLDGLPIGVAVVGQDGRILTVNTTLEHMTGFSRSEAQGMPSRHVVRSGLYQRTFPSDTAQDTDIVNRHRRKIPVRISAVPVVSRDGEPLFGLELLEDLSALRELERRVEEPGGFGTLVGKGAAMERILRLLPSMAQADASVFIIGETGTGKDTVAEAIHKLSPRSREPFIRMNCGPLPPQIIEAELFGRVGTSGEILPGAFQRAGAGTLYLSDIGELPEAQQHHVIEYLDAGLIHPSGSGLGVRAKAKLMVSSPVGPEELVHRGKLLPTLASRLGALRLALPPLRERAEDIEFLLSHFLEIFAAKFKKQVRGFTPKARTLLLRHDYPGNVRELRNIVEFAVMVSNRRNIPPANLPGHLFAQLGEGLR